MDEEQQQGLTAPPGWSTLPAPDSGDAATNARDFLRKAMYATEPNPVPPDTTEPSYVAKSAAAREAYKQIPPQQSGLMAQVQSGLQQQQAQRSAFGEMATDQQRRPYAEYAGKILGADPDYLQRLLGNSRGYQQVVGDVQRTLNQQAQQAAQFDRDKSKDIDELGSKYIQAGMVPAADPLTAATRGASMLWGMAIRGLGGSDAGRTILSTIHNSADIFNIGSSVDQNFDKESQTLAPVSPTGQLISGVVSGAVKGAAEFGISGKMIEGAGMNLGTPQGAMAMGSLSTGLSNIGPVATGKKPFSEAANETAITGLAFGAIGQYAPVARDVAIRTLQRAQESGMTITPGMVKAAAAIARGGLGATVGAGAAQAESLLNTGEPASAQQTATQAGGFGLFEAIHGYKNPFEGLGIVQGQQQAALPEVRGPESVSFEVVPNEAVPPGTPQIGAVPQKVLSESGGASIAETADDVTARITSNKGAGLRMKPGVDIGNISDAAAAHLNSLHEELRKLGQKVIITSGEREAMTDANGNAIKSNHVDTGEGATAIDLRGGPQLAETLNRLGFKARYEKVGQVNANGSKATASHVHVDLVRSPAAKQTNVAQQTQVEPVVQAAPISATQSNAPAIPESRIETSPIPTEEPSNANAIRQEPESNQPEHQGGNGQLEGVGQVRQQPPEVQREGAEGDNRSSIQQSPEREIAPRESESKAWRSLGDNVEAISPSGQIEHSGKISDISTDKRTGTQYYKIEGSNSWHPESLVYSAGEVPAESIKELSAPQRAKQIEDAAIGDAPSSVRDAVLQHVAQGGKLSIDDLNREVLGTNRRIGGKGGDFSINVRKTFSKDGEPFDLFIKDRGLHDQFTGGDEIAARNQLHDVVGDLANTQHPQRAAKDLLIQHYKDATAFPFGELAEHVKSGEIAPHEVEAVDARGEANIAESEPAIQTIEGKARNAKRARSSEAARQALASANEQIANISEKPKSELSLESQSRIADADKRIEQNEYGVQKKSLNKKQVADLRKQSPEIRVAVAEHSDTLNSKNYPERLAAAQKDASSHRGILYGTLPGVPQLLEFGKSGYRLVNNALFLAESASPDFVESLNKGMGMAERRDATAQLVLDDLYNHINRLSEKDQIEAYDNMMLGKPQKTAELQSIADGLKKILNAQLDFENRFLKVSRRENYLPIYYKTLPGKEVGEQRPNIPGARRPLGGSMGFQKQKTFGSLGEAMAAGGEPLTKNMVQAVVMRLADGNKSTGIAFALKNAAEEGRLVFVPHDNVKPESVVSNLRGFVGAPSDFTEPTEAPPEINRVLRKMGMQFPEQGKWYMDKSDKALTDTITAPDPLRSSSIGRGLMAVKNFATSIRLIGGFHYVFTSTLTAPADGGLLLRGGGVAAIKDAFHIRRTGSLVKQAIKNYDSMEEFLRSPDGLRLQDILAKTAPGLPVDELVRAVQVGRMSAGLTDLQYQTAMREFDRAFALAKQGDFGDALKFINPLRDVRLLTELAMHDMFTRHVPHVKLGLFAKEYARRLQEHASDLAEGKIGRAQIANDTRQYVENLMGKINYDSTFWHPTFKTTAQLLFQAPGWRFGILRLIRNGIRAVPEQARITYGAMRGRNNFRLNPNIAYAAAAALAWSAFANILPRATIGRGPKNALEWLYPAYSEDDKGNVKHLVPFFYIRDIASALYGATKGSDFAGHISGLAHSMAEYATSGTSSIFSKTIEAARNRGHFNEQIYDPEQGTMANIYDAAKHILVPDNLALNNARAELKRMGKDPNVLSPQGMKTFARTLTGAFGEPPGHMVSTEFQDFARNKRSETILKPSNEVQVERSGLKNQYIKAVRDGDRAREQELEKQMRPLFPTQKAYDSFGEKTVDQAKHTDNQWALKRMNTSDAYEGWKLMTPEERKEVAHTPGFADISVADVMKEKVASAVKSGSWTEAQAKNAADEIGIDLAPEKQPTGSQVAQKAMKEAKQQAAFQQGGFPAVVQQKQEKQPHRLPGRTGGIKQLNLGFGSGMKIGL